MSDDAPGEGLTDEEKAKRERVKMLLMGKKEKDSGRVIGTVQEGLTDEEKASRERVKRLLAGKKSDRGLTIGDSNSQPVPPPSHSSEPEISVKVESNYLDGAGDSKASSDFDDTATHAAKATPIGGFKRPVRKLKVRESFLVREVTQRVHVCSVLYMRRFESFNTENFQETDTEV